MILQVEKGSFHYDHRPLLHDVNFHVKERQILAILGPNGIGKTTLLRCMMGLLPWQQGRTLLKGRDLRQLKPKEIWQLMAYVPQSKATNMSYTALDMVLMGRSSWLGMFAQPTKEDRYTALESMERLSIGHLKNTKCHCMSGGEFQMVLIARALCTKPKLLVLDEPESNLDFKNQLTILETLRDLAHNDNIASILNTHYPTHALQLADQALLLSHDGVCRYGNCEEIVSEEAMRHAFQVKVKIHNFSWEKAVYPCVIPLSITPHL